MTLLELLTALSDETSKEMQSILSSKGMSDSRIIKQVDIDVEQNGADITLQTNFPEYAEFVRDGRPAGKAPPTDKAFAQDKSAPDMKDWCIRKNIDTKFAFPIAKMIGENGLPPTNFTDPLKEFVEKVKKITEEFYKNKIEESLKESVKDGTNN